MKPLATVLLVLAVAGPTAVAQEPCCPPAAKACIRVPEAQKVTRVVYDMRCEDVCLPRCQCCGLLRLFASPACPTCPVCGKLRTVHHLVKISLTEERCGSKCVPVPLPPPTCGRLEPLPPMKP